jgi:hypothetical protein
MATTGSTGDDFAAANAHNRAHGHKMSTKGATGDDCAAANAHNRDHNFVRSDDNHAAALKRLNPKTMKPMSEYMSDAAGAKALWERKGHIVQDRYDAVVDLFGVKNIEDATVGIAGIDEAEKQAFAHVAPGVRLSQTLRRIREYPRMVAHKPPRDGYKRVAFELASHADAAFMAHGEGIMIDKNMTTFAADSMDNGEYQKRGGVSGAKSVFLSYTDDKGITHGNALPPWNTCLYLMIVVKESILESRLQAAKAAKEEKKRKAIELK